MPIQIDPATETYNPNSVPNGGDLITINGIMYIAEVTTPTASATRVDLPNELGQTKRRPAFLIAQRETGNIEIQIADGDPLPLVGDSFNKNLFGDGELVCVLESLTYPRAMGQYRKVTGTYYVEGAAA